MRDGKGHIASLADRIAANYFVHDLTH